MALPAWEFRDAVVNALTHKQVLIVAGETGCGKSTQVPQFILDSIPAGSPCNMVLTQPRRISAMGLAERVASGVERVGVHIGFTVRQANAAGTGAAVLHNRCYAAHAR